MICKLLGSIRLLDELQYWIDNWTHCNANKRYSNFNRIECALRNWGDLESARIADRARRMSIQLPFSGRPTFSGVHYSPEFLKYVMATP